MNSDQLQDFENQGRDFARRMFNAGFDAQTVEDAAFAPSLRLGGKENSREQISFNEILRPTTKSYAELKNGAATRTGHPVSAHWAFIAGVMFEIEGQKHV